MTTTPERPIVIQTTQQTNGLGVAGFVLSLVGLISCGLISPLAWILSAFGCLKQPRGLAIAGLIIATVGSLWIAFGGLAIGAALIGARELSQMHAAHDDFKEGFVEWLDTLEGDDRQAAVKTFTEPAESDTREKVQAWLVEHYDASCTKPTGSGAQTSLLGKARSGNSSRSGRDLRGPTDLQAESFHHRLGRLHGEPTAGKDPIHRVRWRTDLLGQPVGGMSRGLQGLRDRLSNVRSVGHGVPSFQSIACVGSSKRRGVGYSRMISPSSSIPRSVTGAGDCL